MNFNFIKNWKPKYWGYVFIGYFVYTIIFPIALILVAGIFVLVGIEIGNNPSPVGEGHILKLLVKNGYISAWTFYIYYVSLIIAGLVVPILSLIGGISMLRLKNMGRKIIIGAFSVDLLYHITIILIVFSDIHIKNFIWKGYFETAMFYLFALIDIAIIFYFSKPSVKAKFSEI